MVGLHAYPAWAEKGKGQGPSKGEQELALLIFPGLGKGGDHVVPVNKLSFGDVVVQWEEHPAFHGLLGEAEQEIIGFGVVHATEENVWPAAGHYFRAQPGEGRIPVIRVRVIRHDLELYVFWAAIAGNPLGCIGQFGAQVGRGEIHQNHQRVARFLFLLLGLFAHRVGDNLAGSIIWATSRERNEQQRRENENQYFFHRVPPSSIRV